MKKLKKILPYLIYFLGGCVVFTLGILIAVFVSSLNISLPKNVNFPKLPKAFVIMSGSMEPKVKVGSVVITLPSRSYLQGDIISFSPNVEERNIVTHRIEVKKFPNGIYQEASYITSGDANKTFDSQEIKDKNIIGKVVLTVPYLGYFANFAKTAKGFILLVIVPTTIIIYEELRFLGLELTKALRKIKAKIKRNKDSTNNPRLLERVKLPRLAILIPLFGAFLIFVAISSSFFSDRQKSLQNVLSAAVSFPQTALLENKIPSGNWPIIEDGTSGVLKYLPSGLFFSFDFVAHGLKSGIDYCLIYFADNWPGNHPGAFLGSSLANTQGEVLISNNVNLGFDIPHPSDKNYPNWSKIWLVTCNSYDQVSKTVTGWNPNDWLFETQFVKYTYTTPTPTPTSTPLPTFSPSPTSTSAPTSAPTSSPNLLTIYLDQLGSDISNQYGYNFEYSGASFQNVSFTYQSPSIDKLDGTIHATQLKPFTTYQIKLSGIPTCIDSANGNNPANEYIGYKGRWTCVSANCSGQSASERNRNDSQYESNKLKTDGDPTKECLVGYLVFDYFNADANGNADKGVSTSNSFHVLGCEGNTCGGTGGTFLAYLDPNHNISNPPAVLFCPSDKVDGQIERGSCGGLSLNSGIYHLQMALTEECFHNGINWATVLYGNIDFEITH